MTDRMWRASRSLMILAVLLLVDGVIFVYLRSVDDRVWVVWDYFWYLTLAALLTIAVIVIGAGSHKAPQGQNGPTSRDLYRRPVSSAWKVDGPDMSNHPPENSNHGAEDQSARCEVSDSARKSTLSMRFTHPTIRRRARKPETLKSGESARKDRR